MRACVCVWGGGGGGEGEAREQNTGHKSRLVFAYHSRSTSQQTNKL